jgi:peroxin-19
MDDFDLDDILDGALADFGETVEPNPAASTPAPTPAQTPAPTSPTPSQTQPVSAPSADTKESQLDTDLMNFLSAVTSFKDTDGAPGENQPNPEAAMAEFQKMFEQLSKAPELAQLSQSLGAMGLDGAEGSNSATAPSSLGQAAEMLAQGAEQGTGADEFAKLFGDMADGAGLEEILKKMFGGEGMDGLEGAEGGDMGNILEGMMKNMMSKELLYQPIKEITEKFPKWLEEAKTKDPPVPEEEMKNYRLQLECFQKIVAEFDGGNDANTICNLMQEMNNYGYPPQEVVGDLLPNLPGGPGAPGAPGGIPNPFAGLGDPNAPDPFAGLFSAMGMGEAGKEGAPSAEDSKMLQDACPTQ